MMEDNKITQTKKTHLDAQKTTSITMSITLKVLVVLIIIGLILQIVNMNAWSYTVVLVATIIALISPTIITAIVAVFYISKKDKKGIILSLSVLTILLISIAVSYFMKK